MPAKPHARRALDLTSARDCLCRGDLLDSVENSRERCLQLECPGRIGVSQVAADAALAQSQQQLFRRALVDALCRGTCVELGIEVAAGDELLAQTAVFFGVEVLGAELRQDRNERSMCRDAGERVALESLARIEQPGRDPPSRRRQAARCEPSLRLSREIELVG